MGTRNFGLEPLSDFQSHDKILGLQFIGNGDQSLAAVYVEAGSGFQLQDLYFERLGFGIKARVLRHSIIANIEAIDTHSLIYSSNNTSEIKAADPASHWAPGGSEGGNLSLSNIFYMTQPETLLEANQARGALHFYNTGEIKINNLTIFGGSRGIVLDGQDYNSVSGNKWNLISNVEIAETELEPVYIHSKRQINLSNVMITWGFKNTRNWTSAHYLAPYLTLKNVRNSIFTNIAIDRDTMNSAYQGGHDIGLTDSTANIFSNISITGRPGSTDGTYSHVYLENSSYNTFNVVNCIDADPTVRWKYGLFADENSDHNQLSLSTLRLVKAKGDEVHFDRSGSNSSSSVSFQ
jgi:hypothetical protein